MIRVVLPYHLRTLARVGGEVQLEVEDRATQRSVLDALEARYPVLRGTIRDHGTGLRRPMLRFFACAEDLSNEPPDAPLPAAVATGAEPLFVVGGSAGAVGGVGRERRRESGGRQGGGGCGSRTAGASLLVLLDDRPWLAGRPPWRGRGEGPGRRVGGPQFRAGRRRGGTASRPGRGSQHQHHAQQTGQHNPLA